jgi:aspartyl-tRNA(Asn)/glutamyl-tRNA(Gln) amidotransferase subunit A
VVGFKPSYGRISRHGVVAYANSLDTVGVLSKRVKDARNVFRLLDRYDAKDPTSLSLDTRARLGTTTDNRIRVGVPAEYNTQELAPEIRKAWETAIERIGKFADVVPVSLPTTKYALSVYYILASAEASSNLAKYDGVRYGSRHAGADDAAGGLLFAATRGEGFGPEVKRRIVLGAYSLSSR